MASSSVSGAPGACCAQRQWLLGTNYSSQADGSMLSCTHQEVRDAIGHVLQYGCLGQITKTSEVRSAVERRLRPHAPAGWLHESRRAFNALVHEVLEDVRSKTGATTSEDLSAAESGTAPLLPRELFSRRRSEAFGNDLDALARDPAPACKRRSQRATESEASGSVGAGVSAYSPLSPPSPYSSSPEMLHPRRRAHGEPCCSRLCEYAACCRWAALAVTLVALAVLAVLVARTGALGAFANEGGGFRLDGGGDAWARFETRWQPELETLISQTRAQLGKAYASSVSALSSLVRKQDSEHISRHNVLTHWSGGVAGHGTSGFGDDESRTHEYLARVLEQPLHQATRPQPD